MKSSRKGFRRPVKEAEGEIENWSASPERPASLKLKVPKQVGTPKEKVLSLNDLAAREPENFKRKIIEPDLEGLRDALGKAVEKSEK